jgi:lipopolysaccharide/colanic/teichoic acid biosynthesis glycosyltransferase
MAQRAETLRENSRDVDEPGEVGLTVNRGSRARVGILTHVDVGTASSKPLPSGRLYVHYLKPALDLLGAIVLGLVALPVALAVAIAVRVHLGPGVIYRQQRVGRYGRVFTMYKFRTMRHDQRIAPSDAFVCPDRRQCHKRDDDPRHTGFGRLLRKTSLDELPQLCNVILGHMSLVGPRPELVNIVERYDPWQHERHQVRPGLTGFWQISDRAGGLACEGVDFDIDYLRQVSLLTDCQVLVRTVPVTLRRTGR